MEKHMCSLMGVMGVFWAIPTDFSDRARAQEEEESGAKRERESARENRSRERGVQW